jgi:hypothetical protein
VETLWKSQQWRAGSTASTYSPCPIEFSREQGCQIFLGTRYQNRKNVQNKYVCAKLIQNVPNGHKIFQNFPNGHKIYKLFSNLRPSQIYPNWEFRFENKPSGNPGWEVRVRHKKGFFSEDGRKIELKVLLSIKFSYCATVLLICSR